MMDRMIALTRRSLLRRTLETTAMAALLPAGAWWETSAARADTATALNFQLSWVRSIQYGGYFAGADTGIYKKAGIDLTFTPGGPNIDAVANVVAGSSGLGDRPVGPLIIAREKGIPIKVIGAVFQKSPFSIMSLESKPIRKLADLVGKTVAVGSTARPTMTGILREAGIDPQSVTMVPAAPDPFALVSGQLDAYTGLSTNQGMMLEAKGIKVVTLNLYDMGLPETSGVLYGREDFLTQNHDLVVRFLKASVQSWQWALAHPEETAKITVDKFGSAGLEYPTQLAELKASAPYIEAGVGSSKGLLAIDMGAYDKLLNLYREVGLVKSDMKAKDLCDPSYIDAALKA